MQRRRLVRVPASSANLGPGFDAFAAALGLHVEVEVVESGRFGVETKLDIARDRRNLCVRGFAALHPPDDFTFRIRSQVPLSGGLGSSAAAYVAGLSAAAHLFELDEDLFARAAQLEGHPDNAAAALLGGFVIVAGTEVARFDPPDGLEAVIVVPRAAVRTAVARRALPDKVPLADAVANVAHGAMLTLGLARGDLSLIASGLEDRLHQPYRGHLYPASMELLERARSFGAIGASISGAGPTVLFWTHADTTGAVVAALQRETEGWAEVLRAPFQTSGAEVREL
ncbi:MAG: homoserine kinase [Solirubrobacteraceae bacterium]|jgi:homoserine kinase|nr:homoserine kinase [Solirubrobacteraceae bacterium]